MSLSNFKQDVYNCEQICVIPRHSTSEHASLFPVSVPEQGCPPCFAWVIIVLLQFLYPPLQVFEHSLHSHVVHWQSTVMDTNISIIIPYRIEIPNLIQNKIQNAKSLLNTWARFIATIFNGSLSPLTFFSAISSFDGFGPRTNFVASIACHITCLTSEVSPYTIN